MTTSKAPFVLALSGMLVVTLLLFKSWGNELLAKLPPRAHYPNDRHYAVMKVRAVFELAALAFWGPALSVDQTPLQERAVGSFKPPLEALWFTHDQSLTVASGACAAGSNNLCAVIVGINDPAIRIWANDICGLPIFWDLMPEVETGHCNNGRILDLETLQTHPLNITVTLDTLILHISDHTTIHWQPPTVLPSGCGS
jgi:hypothetical protein